MSFTYSELKQAIEDYTENNEASFVRNIPLFIRQAEERILKNVQLSLFRKNATANAIVAQKYLPCPSDYLAPFSLSYVDPTTNDKIFADFKDVSFLQTYTPDPTVLGKTRYYGIFDIDNFLLAPTPEAAYQMELHYYYRPQSITKLADTGTTWLSINAELTLLYGSLIEAYVYMKGDPDLSAMYNKRFEESLIGIKMLGEAKEVTDEYRTGKVIRAKQ
tara:strand:- start:187 stop:840 length:654 start_codon:yes stop_codon:yes gene_type:complete